MGEEPSIGQFTLFIVEVADVTYIGSESGTGAQHVALWPPGQEYIRPQAHPDQPGASTGSTKAADPGLVTPAVKDRQDKNGHSRNTPESWGGLAVTSTYSVSG